MGSALETLCGLAFGARQVHMLGIYMQRSLIILTSTALVLTPIYVFATPILRLLGQEEQIAQLAGKFTLGIIPQMFSLAITFPTQKFLQSQSKVGVMAWIAFLALLFHVFLLWLFIFFFGRGLVEQLLRMISPTGRLPLHSLFMSLFGAGMGGGDFRGWPSRISGPSSDSPSPRPSCSAWNLVHDGSRCPHWSPQ